MSRAVWSPIAVAALVAGCALFAPKPADVAKAERIAKLAECVSKAHDECQKQRPCFDAALLRCAADSIPQGGAGGAP